MLLVCATPIIYLSAAVTLAPVVPAVPAKAADLPLPPKEKAGVQIIAQEFPKLPTGPDAPPAPPRRGDPPITMCILLDNSGSMRDKRAAVTATALAVVKSAKPDDELCIVDFNDEAYLDLDFTNDLTKAEETIAHYEARGGTAMRDAVRMSIEHLEQRARNDRKVLVLVTEGNDNSSAISQQDLVAELKRSGVRVYCIGLPGEDESREAVRGMYALRQLAKASGGQDFYPIDLTGVEIISPEIAAAVRGQ